MNLKKIIWYVIVLSLLWYVISQPAPAAQLVRGIGGFLSQVGSGIGQFASDLGVTQRG